MDIWHKVSELGDGPFPNWDAWDVEVRLGQMPDGTVAPIGLRIEPRDDYDGSIREQRITLERLRQFPIGAVTAQAKYLAAQSAIPEVWWDDDSKTNLPCALDHLDKNKKPFADWSERSFKKDIAEVENLYQEWIEFDDESNRTFPVWSQALIEASRLKGEAVIAGARERHEAREENRAKFAADLDVKKRQIYRDEGSTERQIDLRRVSDYYREAQRNSGSGGPRRYIANFLGVSLTTVDRLLREARSEGFLEPYDGAQGKHGKKNTNKKVTRDKEAKERKKSNGK